MKMATKRFVLHPILSAILFYAISVLLLLPSARGKVFTVGGSKGWTDFDVSTSSAPNYQAWASSQNIFPGDSIVFKYTPSFHNVYSLPNKLAFDNCNFATATALDGGASGTFTWVAPSQAGQYYFACSKSIEGQGSHCTAGQKIAITVSPTPINPFKHLATSSPAPAPGISTPSSSPRSHPTSAPSPFTYTPAGSPHSPRPAPAHAPSGTPIPSPIPPISTPIGSPAPIVPILAPSSAPASHPITPVAPQASTPSPIPSSTPPTAPPPKSQTPVPSPHSQPQPVPPPSIPVPSAPTPPTPTPTPTPPLPSPSIPSLAPAYVPSSPALSPATSPEVAPVPVGSPLAPAAESPESFPAASPGPDGSQPNNAGTQITQQWWAAFLLAWAVFFVAQSAAAWL